MKKTLTAALLLATTAVTACSATEPQPVRQAAKSTVAWAPCEDLTGPDGKPLNDTSLECGSVPVPLDPAKPEGEKIDLALIRIKATGDRLGSLVFNFGGPGASGVDTLALAAKLFASLGTRYDLVSFDPRGVERSSGVRCGQIEKYLSVDMEDLDSEKLTKEFVAACAKDSGKVLPHVGTVNAAEDLERLRTALGDAKLNYFGLSYGTHLGAVYATRYPKNVGRFVLDGAYDPTVTFKERAVTQVKGFKQAFDAFAKDCVAQGCDLGGDPAAVQKSVDELLAGLKAKPVKVGDRDLTSGLAEIGVFAALYSTFTWPVLEQAVAAAVKGNGQALLSMADSYVGRKPDGTYSTMMTSVQAISCMDSAERPDDAAIAEVEKATGEIYPMLRSGGLGLLCRNWPVKGDDAAKRIDATGSAPIVVVGGKGDPATPYEWAPKLTAQLKTGVLLTYEGEGHGAYLSGSSCVTRALDTYLLTGKTPAPGTTCPAA
ncbi:alpha/beta hydrolase [Nonomuraea sp. NBC_01738]|uniref:alpha/beta hydrolase n=1 Tax=Nonomuraea sp. NBC_01738 TaxID=2976003 RepID=UPI002E13179C|nr:alpha/beta hydrolase [Nonomuraea sp. NBC_01738]